MKKSKEEKAEKPQKIRIFNYNSNWEKESWAQGWLTKAEYNRNDLNQAYCKVCFKTLRAQANDLKKHSAVPTHSTAMKNVNINMQKTIVSMRNVQFKKEEKERDLKIAAFIASHTSIRNIDHLSNILKSSYPEFKNFQMHRTKCSNLITNVIAPNILTNLIEDIGDMAYSMMVDESTDVSVTKYLCLCIKYFSCTKNRIVTEYLGIIQIEHADANSLHSAVIEYSKDIGLNLSKMIGLGTDGGSNLCGKKHSLFTLLRSKNPNLQLVRCVCHALNNAASAAAEEFPAAVEFLCKEVYNWFNNSSVRRSAYKLTWDTMNQCDKSNKNDSQKDFHKFVKLSSTRWLARFNVIRVILAHYSELQTHFNLVVDTEKCYTSRLLCQMLQDNSNFLYLTIIKPILYEVNDVNLSFQRENVDLGLAYDDLKDLIILLAGKIMKPSFLTDLNLVIESLDNELAFLPVKDADFGIEYYAALTSITISQESKFEVETRAYKYIKTLCVQLSSRLPTNLAFYKNLKSVSPTVCLNQIRPKFKNLPLLKQFVAPDSLGLIENQYNKLLSIDWTKILDEKVLENSYAFWPALYNFKNAGGKFIFRELALFILKLLSLPSSNAVVERVFSIMNIVKTKIRNRMLLVMLDAILRIRLHFYANNTCCFGFQPTNDMLKDFNYKVMYNLNDADVEKVMYETEIAIGKVLENFENSCSL